MSRHDAALAAEAEVIGAALNDPTRVRELGHLRPEHFVSALYGRIWRLIGEAAEEARGHARGAGQLAASSGDSIPIPDDKAALLS